MRASSNIQVGGVCKLDRVVFCISCVTHQASLSWSCTLHLGTTLKHHSVHNAPIFRLLLKVAVNGTHQCDFLNFCGGFGSQQTVRLRDIGGLPSRKGEFVLITKKLFTLLDLCVSSLRRGHANLLCIVPILTDDPRRESKQTPTKDCRQEDQNTTRLKSEEGQDWSNGVPKSGYNCHRSHFGSRYKLGCCGHAGLFAAWFDSWQARFVLDGPLDQRALALSSSTVCFELAHQRNQRPGHSCPSTCRF